MAENGPVDLTATQALEIVSRFLTKEWKSLKPEDVEVKTIQAGFNNTVYIVMRVDGKCIKEPRAVIMRKYGGQVISETAAKRDLRPLSLMEEVLVVQALSFRKLMPKIIGLFDGGRIEEFIECRQMTGADIEDPTIFSDLAKNMARVHALNVPLPVPGYKFIDALRQQWNGYLEENPIDGTVEHDFHIELDFLQPLLEPSDHRIVFMNWDPHFENVCLRTNPREGELKTIIFDYEMAGYNIRGKDLGLVLMAMEGARRDHSVKSFMFAFPDFDYCRSFLRLYLDECKVLFDDIDEDGVDSMDHMLVESLVGAMVSCLCFYFALLRVMEGLKAKHSSERFEEYQKSGQGLKNTYFDCKSILVKHFPDPGLVLKR